MAEQKGPGSPSLPGPSQRQRGGVSSPGTLQQCSPPTQSPPPSARPWFGSITLRPRSSSKSSLRAAGHNPRDADSSSCPGATLRSMPRSTALSDQTEELFERIAITQSQRINDQRASISRFPKLSLFQPGTCAQCGACCPSRDPGLDTGLHPDLPNEEFFDMLIQYQSSRLEDQRCHLPEPQEVFFSLVQRVQASRIEDQRALLQQTSPTAPDSVSLPRLHTESKLTAAPCSPTCPPFESLDLQPGLPFNSLDLHPASGSGH